MNTYKKLMQGVVKAENVLMAVTLIMSLLPPSVLHAGTEP